jgi:translation initiation factor 2B subunit (eIF-2B alpha/beta/delta family)
MIIPVEWTDEGVKMLDQRLLPTEEKWLMLKTYREVADGITDMVVRGAPAIGVSAAYGIALGARGFVGTNMADFEDELDYVCQTLAKTRPTAVNLFWAIDRMKRTFQKAKADGKSISEIGFKIEREQQLEMDVVFVGAGPANLAAALHLKNAVAEHDELVERAENAARKSASSKSALSKKARSSARIFCRAR